MSCGNAVNVRIEPSDLTYKIEEQWCVKTVADSSSSLNNKYFTLSSTTVDYYVWFNVGAAGVDPAPAGKTAIEVAISANATAAAVASAMQTAVDGVTNVFDATVSSDEVTITNLVAGDVTATADNNTGFTFTQLQEGGNLTLGLTQGDITINFEESLKEVVAHQSGVTPLLDLRSGVKVDNIEVAMLESDMTKLKEIFAKHAGGSETPSGGTEVSGWGTSRVGTNTIVQARRLIFHPTNLGASDYSRDLCFWKAYLMPSSIVYSGENEQIVNVSFKIYKDENKNDVVNYFVFGDHTQYDPA